MLTHNKLFKCSNVINVLQKKTFYAEVAIHVGLKWKMGRAKNYFGEHRNAMRQCL